MTAASSAPASGARADGSDGTPEPEPSLRDRLSEHPGFAFERVRQARPRDLAVRFAAGALTSVLAGVLGLVAGPRIGGVMLAFPAILAASLTLIEEEEDAVEAREDARGAIVGSLGLVAFAACAWVLLGRLPGGLVLLCAGAVWAVVALTLYRLLWFRR